MARQIKNTKIDTRNARDAIPIGAAIIYADLGVDGADLGYRKGKTGGKWVLRRYVGAKKYAVETLALADDRADADGVGVLNYRQAQALARSRHEALTRQERGLPDSSGPYTVAHAMADYLSHKEAEGGKSVDDARIRSDALIVPQIGGIEVAKLTPKHIRDWMGKIVKTPPRLRTKAPKDGKGPPPVRYRDVDLGSPEIVRKRRATANRMLGILKAGLNLAWREGRTPSDEAWRKVQPFREANAARLRYLSVDEARRLIEAAEGGFRALVEAALQTGARYSELASFRVSDFNADAGTVHVRASKGGRARHIVLTDEGNELFRRLCEGKAPTGHILVRDDGSQWRKGYHLRLMREAAERAGFGPDVSFHILRHTWASLAVMNGVPLMVVSANLGHADTRMVERHYGHLAQSYKADVIRANAPRFSMSADTSSALPLEAK
ncbi:Site-specific recombinase XerD [Azospirillum oryzae]|uniref:Site-specific recombinase XerD n=1 Tax=Azospirillum oryzae TaxID=286727 RepID=A0A1X7HT37_9PROT|nr:site-specific integrase [Azospirillum oryzae]SMF92307.1 Site-specific recombinase XerD [Azospirillum oryzae]